MLTKVNTRLIDASGTEQGATITSDGESAEFTHEDSADIKLVSGTFDTESGILSLVMSNDTRITVQGFLTSSNMGVGPMGPTGPKGKNGTNGRDGKDGRRGDKGCPGPKGDRGLKGERGATGPRGLSGEYGGIGATGPTGPTGPAGIDGKSPTISETNIGAYEQFSQQSLKLWGKHRVDPDVTLNSVQITFDKAFRNDSGERVAFVQFLGTSNVRNSVNISEVGREGFTVSVDTNSMPTDSAGNPLPKTGWSFNWTVLGTDF